MALVPRSISTVSSSKRPRQAIACEWCRSHKLKCDTQHPACRNCQLRGVTCVTTNLRRLGAEARRIEPLGRRGSRQSRRQNSIPQPLSFTESPQSRQPYPSSQVRPSAELEADRGPLPPIFALPFDQTIPQNDPDVTLPVHLSPRSGTPGSTELSARTNRASSRSSFQPSTTASNLTLVTDRSYSRRQVIGSGSSQYVLVQWLDMFFANHDTWAPIFPYFQQGLAYSLEMPLPFPMSLPQLPPQETMQTYISTYFTRIHPIFPVLDEDSFRTSQYRLREKLEQNPPTLGSQDYPALACAYAVFSAGADEADGLMTQAGTQFLEGAYFLYAHLVAIPYFTSVQALLLLTMILRNRNKDGASWGTLGQAIRIAQSIGLHRHVQTPASPSSISGGTASHSSQVEDLHSRIWWAAYILERTMELETGRPSAIRDDECDQILPNPITSGNCDFDYFGASIRLSRIQTRAINLLYGGNKHQRKNTKELLIEMGRIDRALVDWADDFPRSIRPGHDLHCGAEELHLATYLTLHYHQTMIALHRPALMSALGFLRSRINEYCAGTPWKDRLHFSLCIGAASARAIMKALNDLWMYANPSRIITVNQTLLAILVLGIYATKIPMSKMNSSDLALLVTFAEQAEKDFISMGQDAEFSRGLAILRDQLSEHISSAGQFSAIASCNNGLDISMGATSAEIDLDAYMTSLDESWPLLWTEDFSTFLANDSEQDMLNMYLLGLPRQEK